MILAPLLCLVFASAQAEITIPISVDWEAVRKNLLQVGKAKGFQTLSGNTQSATEVKTTAQKALKLFDKTKKKLDSVGSIHIYDQGNANFIERANNVCQEGGRPRPRARCCNCVRLTGLVNTGAQVKAATNIQQIALNALKNEHADPKVKQLAGAVSKHLLVEVQGKMKATVIELIHRKNRGGSTSKKHKLAAQKTAEEAIELYDRVEVKLLSIGQATNNGTMNMETTGNGTNAVCNLQNIKGNVNADTSGNGTLDICNFKSIKGNVNFTASGNGNTRIETFENDKGVANFTTSGNAFTSVGTVVNSGGTFNLFAKLRGASQETRMRVAENLDLIVDDVLSDEDADPKVKALKKAVIQAVVREDSEDLAVNYDNGDETESAEDDSELDDQQSQPGGSTTGKKTLCVFTPDREYCVTQQKDLS